MTQENTEAKANKLPWPVIIMLGMLTMVIGLGFFLSPKSETDKLWWVNLLGTTNYGILLNPPVPVSVNEIQTSEGQPWSAFDNDTFKLVVINEGDCEEACQDMLLSTKQLHVRLNRDYEDVERAFLPKGIFVEQAQGLVAELDDYTLLNPNQSKLLQDLSTTNIPALNEGPVLLMIDPANLAMMAYTKEHTGSEVLEDLEHLLELAR